MMMRWMLVVTVTVVVEIVAPRNQYVVLSIMLALAGTAAVVWPKIKKQHVVRASCLEGLGLLIVCSQKFKNSMSSGHHACVWPKIKNNKSS